TSRSVENGRLRCPGKNRRSAGRVTCEVKRQAQDRLQSQAGRRGPRRGADFTVHVALFDVLAVGNTDWRPRPYTERRTELLRLLEAAPATLRAVPATEDRGQAL
ncbi:hypothetical protein ACFYZB_38575, partial [Streptomyces sp. NPDC001852]